MGVLMRSRLFWRRSAAAAGIYASVVLGFFGTVIVAHAFTTRLLGLYALVIAATGFFQTLLDLTIEEALVKYGFRFQEREDWGRLRRLFGRALQLKLAGGVVAGLCLLALAPAAHALFGDARLLKPMLIAAALPLVQAPENVGGVSQILRGRYEISALLLFR
jgi:O-antigen/teichoic acid export membrane protein